MTFLASVLGDWLVKQVHEKEEVMLRVVLILNVILEPMGRAAGVEWEGGSEAVEGAALVRQAMTAAGGTKGLNIDHNE